MPPRKKRPLHPPLPADTLRWRCDPAVFGKPSTAGLPAHDGWVGEERTRETVRLALRVPSRSHHLILRGPPGTGPRTLLRECLGELDGGGSALLDRVYVQRFDDRVRPRLVSTPAGEGRRLVDALDRFADRMNTLGGSARGAARREIRDGIAALRSEVAPLLGKAHLAALRARVLQDLPTLCSAEEGDDASRLEATDAYRGRQLRDATGIDRPPFVELTQVDARELFGGIDDPSGDAAPGPADLTAGALVRADGGVCAIPAEELLTDMGLLRRLVSTLLAGEVEMRPTAGSPAPAVADYRPDPVPITTRVVALGVRAHRLNALLEPSARRAFGLLADTGSHLPYDDAVAGRWGGFLSGLCRGERLLPGSAAAAARLLEEQVRDAEGRGRISNRLALLADRTREANLLARVAGRRRISARDVDDALRARRWRAARGEEDHRERLATRRLRVLTEGAEVGVVNGLLVYGADGYRYGAPSRISATTAVGREGVINIERESKLSGKTFDKGVYLLVGLLRARFAQRDPLGLVAMLTCEQSHGRIDGDSAAAAELAAILSDLAGTPVDQGIAITGSVSQRGELYTVGSVNPKVEGFYLTCRDRGLTGTQGVILPRRNADDLVLDPEVVTACRKRRFHVWTLDTIDEALEVLTGLPAGTPDPQGRYPEGTVMGRAQKRMAELSRRMFPPRKAPSAKPKKKG